MNGRAAVRAATDELVLRQVDLTDGAVLADVVALCGRALGWGDADDHAAFFRWKHLEGPFGVSPAWVAEADGRLVGVRVLMRWEALGPGAQPLRLARAVDTATDPVAQGRGIFSRLTALAVDELGSEGVAAIFNTPNAKSLPGYLKLGWSALGRVPVRLQPRRPSSLPALVHARTEPAGKWGEPTPVGLEPVTVLHDEPAIQRLLGALAPLRALHTPRSTALLRWRFSFGPLHYRAALVGSSIEDGLVFFRLRRRGALRELTVCDALVPPSRPRSTARLLGRLARSTGADVLTSSAATRGALWPGLTSTAIGPVLTWRPLGTSPGRVPPMDELGFTHADLELF